MAGLSVPETLSLEELHAETCLALPERDLMQTVTIVNTNGAGSGAGSSVFSEGVGVGIGVLVLAPPA